MNRTSLTSIQRQLQLFFVLTLGFTVLIMGAVWIGYNQVLLEKEAERVLVVESDIIGAAARPAMMFNDQRMAGELLRTMQFDPDISVVRLFTYDGKILFTYTAEGDAADRGGLVAFQKSQSSAYVNGSLRLYRVVTHKGEPVGVIYLESRLNHLKESQKAGYVTVAVVMTICLILGLLLASRLQKKIAEPISSLARLMRQMGGDRDFSLRADSKTYNRESQELLAGFNLMADEIQNSFHVIKENEKRFRNIVELAPMPVVISRKSDGRILFLNDAAAQLLALDGSEEPTFPVLDFFHSPDERDTLIGKVVAQGELTGFELEAVRDNDVPFWISLSMSRINFEGEEALFSAFVDITDQKNIEKRLEEEVADRTEKLKYARDELQSTLDNMQDTYYRIATDGTVIWASSAVHTLLGYSADEVVGMPLHDIWVGGCEYAQAETALIKSDGVLTNHKVQLRCQDNRLIWAAISAHLIVDQQQVIGIEGVIRDITQQVQAEQQRQEMEAKMAHVQRLESLGVLAGGIAHDFNNILAGIMGNAELAELNIAESISPKQELKNIVVSSIRAADLCKQMLAYSGQGSLVRKPLNLSALVQDTVQLIDVSISKSVALKFDLHAYVPDILADNTQIQQVVMNLITNASEAIGESGSGEIHIKTGCLKAGRDELKSRFIEEDRPEGEYVFLEVNDSGSGMDEATMNRIFDPFFSTKFTGRGLGMSAVLGIVRSHHGTMQVESSPGKGSMFKILFPVYAASDDQGLEKVSDLAGRVSVEGMNILVVEDEEMVRNTFDRLLRKLGCRVLMASDGRQGVHCFSENRGNIDAVLLDLTMPVMGGKEALMKLRELDIEVPVIICSGYSDEKVVRQFEGMPPSAFLQKPFTLKSLYAAINQSLF